MAEIDDIPERALAWHRAGRRVAVATVIETWGSAPRPVGSLFAIAETVGDGVPEMAGSVSGGCVEAAVVAEALAAMEDGRSRLLAYGVSDDEAFAVGLACGGRIRIAVDPVGAVLSPEVLEGLVTARAARRPVALAADLESGARALVGGARPLGAVPEAALAAAAAALADGRPALAEGVFVGVHMPPLRLVVVGAVHIAQPLVAMARLAGYDPTVVDPRAAFASEMRFPGEALSQDWPDAALAALAPDARTAVVTLTHDPKLDDPALMAALPGPAFYVGALGSTRTHAKRVARLREAGLAEAAIARLHAPVGLDIGAATPAEIAVAILAEMTLRLRRPAGTLQAAPAAEPALAPAASLAASSAASSAA